MKYRDLLNDKIECALNSGKEESAILLLLLHYSKKESYELYRDMELDVPNDVYDNFNNAVEKYINDNIPVQHIIGYEYFYGYKFMVSDKCLIPRRETEELVENILYKYDDLFKGKKVSVADVGTGSGCIAISLALEESNMNVMASDISVEAINVAKENALALQADVNFVVGDMLEPFKGKKFDILVSNPPYIPDSEIVDPLVKDNEPNEALFGGDDGLKFYRIILKGAKELLNDKFIIAFEHAYDKGNEMIELAKQYFSDCKIEVLKDMQNKDRMTFIVKE